MLLEALPGGFNAIPDIVARRATVEQMLAMMEIPENPNVAKDDRTVPGPTGEPDISVRIYRPRNATGTLPGIYYIHGGGMVLGTVAGEDATASSLCDEVNAVNPGSYHASEVFAPDAQLSQRIRTMRIDALRRALA